LKLDFGLLDKTRRKVVVGCHRQRGFPSCQFDFSCYKPGSEKFRRAVVAKKAKKVVRREYTKADVKELRAHSKSRTPIAKIVKLTKRSEGSLRQKARSLGIGLGHQRRK
jgi:hypothetical protein